GNPTCAARCANSGQGTRPETRTLLSERNMCRCAAFAGRSAAEEASSRHAARLVRGRDVTLPDDIRRGLIIEPFPASVLLIREKPFHQAVVKILGKAAL